MVVPFFDLGPYRPPSPNPVFLPQPVAPAPEPAPAIKNRKSILKMSMPTITWDHHGQPNKLQKKPPKQVHYAELEDFGAAPTVTPLAVPELGAEASPPTPAPTPDSKVKRKGSIISRMLPKSSVPPMAAPSALLPTPPPSTSGAEAWHHHTSYFPEYEPIYPAPTAVPGLPGVTNHAAYFPDYSPIFHASHPVNAYPGASGALAYALTTPEAVAAAHAQRVGHAVSVHYPDLPRFADYGAKNPPNWQTGKWGVEGWTGFGWNGEKLPDLEGMTFGNPMPKGEPIAPEGGGKGKKKGKGGGDGDGDGGGDGDEGEEDKAEAKPEGEAAEGGEAAAGGGGGGKNKKKKKK